MCEVRFYVCRHCGNLMGLIYDAGAPIICCGEPMTELVPGSVDASHEKHVPVIKREGDTVTVRIGSVDHPMIEAHHIAWIYIQTDVGGQRKCLTIDGAPEASFCLGGDKLIAAYAYCNLHGLWKADA